MISFGIHFGFFSIRVSQCFKRRGEDNFQFRPLTQPDYGMEDWWPLYQGVMPNVYDLETCTVGYEALKRVGKIDFKRLHRFDRKFFEVLIKNTVEQTQESHIWELFLSSLSQDFLNKSYSALLGLFLEGVDLVKQNNPWMPWQTSEDLHEQLANLLSQHFSSFGFEKIFLLREKQVIENLVSSHTGMKSGELLLNLGGDRSSFWFITDQALGETRILDNCPGINTLYKNILKNGDQNIIDLLNFLNQNNNRPSQNLLSMIDRWRKTDLLPALYNSWASLEDSGLRQKIAHQNLWVAGEGAYLAAGLNDKIKLGEHPLYLHSDAAAKCAFLSG